MLKSKPSKEQMELVKDIGIKIHSLAVKEGEIEICALIPFSLLKTAIIVSKKHDAWPMLIMLADMVSRLSGLIDEIDIPLEALKEFSEMGIEVA